MRDIVGHRYRVEQRVAAGGFGAIYRATDLLVGRQVALKVLHRELAGDTRVVARFRREAAALATLKSPHTLTLYDIGQTEDTFYLVMELLRGESLQDVFAREGALSWRRMAHIARGVCSSLREAHELGIVHRDLKPANLFIEVHALDADFVKVLDFGIAKVLTGSDLDQRDLTLHGQMVGTFDYMAPEQMIGAACTAKSDVFTLGVVMYEMITGGRPYGEAATPAAMLMAMLAKQPAPIAGVPADLCRVITRCLARDPDARPAIAELDDVLARAIEEGRARRGGTPDRGVPELALDMDEPTHIGPRMSLPTRVTRPRGSVMPIHAAAELARGAQPVLGTSAMVDDDLENADTVLAPTARGSVAAIDAAIDEVLRSPFAHGTDADARPVASEPAPVVHLSTPAAAPRARLASGTRPIANAPAPENAPEPAGAALMVRMLVIAAGLFGVGFAAALVIASL